MGPWAHKICGALGLYNHFRSWAHGALGSESLWGLKFIESMGPSVHQSFEVLGSWGLRFIEFMGPWVHNVCGVLGS